MIRKISIPVLKEEKVGEIMNSMVMADSSKFAASSNEQTGLFYDSLRDVWKYD